MVCPPVRKIIHSLELVDYLLVQVDKTWYNYYLAFKGLLLENFMLELLLHEIPDNNISDL